MAPPEPMATRAPAPSLATRELTRARGRVPSAAEWGGGGASTAEPVSAGTAETVAAVTVAAAGTAPAVGIATAGTAAAVGPAPAVGTATAAGRYTRRRWSI